MIRIVSIIVATLLFCYIVFVSFFFRESRQKELCRDLQVVVVDSLDKHFVSESDLVHILKKADLNPIKRPMDEINTDRIENELLKNEMIARVEAYKTPSGMIKLEVEQKIPILRVISPRGNYYVFQQFVFNPVGVMWIIWEARCLLAAAMWRTFRL